MESDGTSTERVRIPRSRDDDYTAEWAAERRDFVRAHTDTDLPHMASFSFDPEMVQGNVENFMGVAQIPVGVAGPLRITGEHAQGDFYVPLATTEGTLVASYSRGMRLLTESGGVTTTVVDDYMQRAPAFVLSDAREAREFGEWVEAARASSPTSVSTPSARCGTCGSTTRRATPPART
jgi:hydroxymethylglutaryl-CoA reductase (NADPH)